MYSFRQHDLLCEWLFAHQKNPFPSEVERRRLSDLTSLTVPQVANWLTHARRRILVGSTAGRGGVGGGGGGGEDAGGGVVRGEVGSSDESETHAVGGSLYATEPTKTRCDVCYSDWKLLGEFKHMTTIVYGGFVPHDSDGKHADNYFSNYLFLLELKSGLLGLDGN